MAEQILSFFEGAKWIAHNATFDMGFVNAELGRLGLPPIAPSEVIDTLSLARRKHPMGPNSLDALCKRYGIDNSHRAKHGALLDSELLAEVYIEMIGGRQAALGLAGPGQVSIEENEAAALAIAGRQKILADRVTEAERQAHDALVAKMGGKALWARYQ